MGEECIEARCVEDVRSVPRMVDRIAKFQHTKCNRRYRLFLEFGATASATNGTDTAVGTRDDAVDNMSGTIFR